MCGVPRAVPVYNHETNEVRRMAEERPLLDKTLSTAEFLAWYWLREELVRFCRAEGLPAHGSKGDLSARIEACLSGKPLPPVRKKPRKAAAMPARFGLDTVIGDGRRCSQGLRRFFESHCGRVFHFNEALRRFISEGSGKTLAEALDVYRKSMSQGRTCRDFEIADQFEYNRHMREYFLANPGASRIDAIAAWKEKRRRRKE
jgi:hypothetical protein